MCLETSSLQKCFWQETFLFYCNFLSSAFRRMLWEKKKLLQWLNIEQKMVFTFKKDGWILSRRIFHHMVIENGQVSEKQKYIYKNSLRGSGNSITQFLKFSISDYPHPFPKKRFLVRKSLLAPPTISQLAIHQTFY